MKYTRKVPAEVLARIDRYRSMYEILAPDNDSISMTQELWKEWEKQGETPPDILNIANTHSEYENGFFYDIINVAELIEGNKLNIYYCAFTLDRYNFYAISSNKNYIVLVDDIFFQLLFFIVITLTYNAQGCINKDRKSVV